MSKFLSIFIGIAVALQSSAWAGEFSEIDLLVREAVGETYQVQQSKRDQDIFHLHMVEALAPQEDHCLIVVSGSVRTQKTTHTFRACVDTQDTNWDYVVTLMTRPTQR